jgi:hypothetical protein
MIDSTMNWNRTTKLIIASVLAAGLIASAIVIAMPVATAVPPMKGSQMANITGSVSVKDAIKNFIKENQKVTFSQASQTAESQINNGTVAAGRLGITQGYLVYTFLVLDSGNETASKVIIDAGNGQVLHTSEAHAMKGFGFMHGEGKGGHWNDHRMVGGMWLDHKNLGENQTMNDRR